MNPQATTAGRQRLLLGMNGYQWTVLLAAWLGWGFDVFDGQLFNFVAPNCVPTLLGLTIGSPAAKVATLQWTGILTSVLLVGWAIGGIVFGQVADRIGGTRTLMLTMLLYAFGTAAGAFAPNIWVLMLFRVISSLGIGGEWAADPAMVAEVMPESRRVEAEPCSIPRRPWACSSPLSSISRSPASIGATRPRSPGATSSSPA